MLAGVVAALGCGAPARCTRASDCGPRAVCGFDATCGPLRPPEAARFTTSRWLSPRDWAVAGARGRLDDAMPVGGRTEALLAFGSLPEGSRILRALLVLHPHDESPRVGAATELVVERVGRFRGGALPARHGAQPTAFAAAVRPLDEGPVRITRLDVTDAARDADDGRLYLLVRGDAEPALLFASPWANDPERHPRLELMVR